MINLLSRWVSTSAGAFIALLVAAALEVVGDSFFQSGLYRSSGMARALWFAMGVSVLAVYGLFVNLPKWEFGKLLGSYVVLFFVLAQVVAWMRFGEVPTRPVWVGGVLIVSGGLVITLWKG